MQQNSEKKSPIDWKSLIAEQEKSGLSQREFCIQRDLVVSQFVYHRCKFKNKDKVVVQAAEPVLKPVKIISKEPSVVSGDIRLSLPNGFQCSFPCSFDANQVKRLIEVLLSC
jgi:hypothetical protein